MAVVIILIADFELPLCKTELSIPILCALIYRHPKFNKSFISEFYDLLSVLVAKFGHKLIVGDINIHTYCPSKQMATDFMHLIDSFNLTQILCVSMVIPLI